ncbi:MAG: FxLYD domain-containing protein, partial [Anaerolineales bacterium]
MNFDNRKGIFYTLMSLTLVGLACNFVLGAEPTLAPIATEVAIQPPTNTSESPTILPEEISLATETAQSPTPTPTNPPTDVVAVTAVNGYPDIYGGWHIVGLITNNSARTVDNVEVEIHISDASGNNLYNQITMALLYTLSPGEISPFTLWVSEEIPSASNFNATIVGQSSAEVTRPEFETRGEVLTIDDEGDIHVTGELVNIGAQPLTVNGLAAAAFDVNGEIVTADFMDAAIRYLDPGESGPFRITMIRPIESVESVASYELYSDVIPAQEE